RGISPADRVVTSPATTTNPVVTRHSTATRLFGSCRSSSSSTEALIWSAIFSGCPSVTASEKKSLGAMRPNLPAFSLRKRLIPNVMRKRVFAAGDRSCRTFCAQKDDLVVGLAEDQIGTDLVQDQHVATPACEVGTTQVEQCGIGSRRLGCKTDQNLTRVCPSSNQTREHIGGLHQSQLEPSVGRFLDLGLTGVGRCEVGGCRRHDRDVGVLGGDR